MMNLEFARPHYLWLLLVLIPIVAWYVVRRHKEPSLGVSSALPFVSVSGGWRVWIGRASCRERV